MVAKKFAALLQKTAIVLLQFGTSCDAIMEGDDVWTEQIHDTSRKEVKDMVVQHEKLEIEAKMKS